MLKWADLGELYAQLRTYWVFSCSSKLPDKVREKTWLRFTLLGIDTQCSYGLCIARRKTMML
jgi:hypothetical protein